MNPGIETSAGEPALISASQLVEQSAGLPAAARAQLFEMLSWLETSIAKPNPLIGRKGHVCPFVGPALTRFRSIRFHVYQGELRPAAVEPVLRALAARFPTLPPATEVGREFRAILTLFPELPHDGGPVLIDPVQYSLKPEITALGLMIGQFYPGCLEPGLHNPDYRPLEAPHPMLVIRSMQLTDLMFLFSRPECLRAYVRKFGVSSRDELMARVAAADIPKLPTRWEAVVDAAFPSEANVDGWRTS
ncbi:DUF6875 domain-containing protein [Polyangium sp. y55x31]|uniref:DUF6875 domain-containing protein n=1 Tax=Polyangium sp. y55x31 TaxID=3042688 RepID=UPI00248300A3|nr:hypothetical protein [Polyangium sp. y55x31]MDI1475889.1 hypothetical protein [Polyangium sp. y55x31]